MLPIDEAKTKAEANEWSSMVLSGDFMMRTIVRPIIDIVYEMTGTHYITKWFTVILIAFMSFSIIGMQKRKKSV
ncbi:hypothetical protein ACH0B6_09380 [Solibacillus silvestris]